MPVDICGRGVATDKRNGNSGGRGQGTSGLEEELVVRLSPVLPVVVIHVGVEGHAGERTDTVELVPARPDGQTADFISAE